MLQDVTLLHSVTAQRTESLRTNKSVHAKTITSLVGLVVNPLLYVVGEKLPLSVNTALQSILTSIVNFYDFFELIELMHLKQCLLDAYLEAVSTVSTMFDPVRTAECMLDTVLLHPLIFHTFKVQLSKVQALSTPIMSEIASV